MPAVRCGVAVLNLSLHLLTDRERTLTAGNAAAPAVYPRIHAVCRMEPSTNTTSADACRKLRARDHRLPGTMGSRFIDIRPEFSPARVYVGDDSSMPRDGCACAVR